MATSLGSAIKARFDATIGPQYPGGLWRNRVGVRSGVPYAVYSDNSTDNEDFSDSIQPIISGAIQFTIFAAGSAQVTKLSDALFSAFQSANAAASNPLAVANATVIHFRENAEGNITDAPRPSVSGGDLWQSVLTFDYQIKFHG